MAQRSNLLRHLLFTISLTAGALASPIGASAEPLDFSEGFRLGGSFEDAKRHARAQGWQLVSIAPELPGQWQVKGSAQAQISLFVCADKVASVSVFKPGDLDDFATLVAELQIALRQLNPEVKIITFRAGATRISNIDVHFAEWDGHRLSVQLSSTDGCLGISTNYYSRDVCPSQ